METLRYSGDVPILLLTCGIEHVQQVDLIVDHTLLAIRVCKDFVQFARLLYLLWSPMQEEDAYVI